MVHENLSGRTFSNPPQKQLFAPVETLSVAYPIQSVDIDWDRLIA